MVHYAVDNNSRRGLTCSSERAVPARFRDDRNELSRMSGVLACTTGYGVCLLGMFAIINIALFIAVFLRLPYDLFVPAVDAGE